MANLSSFINNLRKKLFGGKPEKQSNLLTKLAEKASITTRETPPKSRTAPYFIQIGFDFGTSYSKCVCRDIITNQTWVHLFRKSNSQESPFLIPSSVILDNGELSYVSDGSLLYPENGLYHIKTALVCVAKKDKGNPVLKPYQQAGRIQEINQVTDLVTACAVYFLSGILGEIKTEIKNRFPGFGKSPEDYIAVNMAIPIQDAEQSGVNKLYEQILNESWQLSEKLSGHPNIRIEELNSLRNGLITNEKNYSNGPCYLYPEVSANVQGFIRSRASNAGLYLCSDTGGGTVDQSIFIFTREEKKEHLTYLAGRVLPLGSSHIEMHAAQEQGDTSNHSLEEWKNRKENEEYFPQLNNARHQIAKELFNETGKTLALTKKKLYVKDQLSETKIIFSGGGHCSYPYQSPVLRPFKGNLFREEVHPDIIGMPIPKDLDLESHQSRWMRRLNVAYGLSFVKSELAPFTFPQDVNNPEPEEIWQPIKKTAHAPGKDEC